MPRAYPIAPFADEICRRYLAGEDTVRLAEAFKVNNTSVQRLLNRRGVSTTRTKTNRVEARIDEAITLHQSGLSMEAVADHFGVSVSVITPLFRKYGVKLHKTWKPISSAQQKELVTKYMAGKSTYKLATEYGLTPDGILKCIKRQGTAARPRGYRNRRLPLDESVFDTITEESAYWIGFLMGDGCVRKSRDGHRLMLALAERDRGHLESFRAFLKSGHAIVESIRGDVKINKAYDPNVRRLQVCFAVPSKRLVEAVGQYGIVPRKTHVARVIGLEHDRHFWRGAIDADGCLTTNRGKTPCIYLCGARPLMEQFSAFVRAHVDCTASVATTRSIYRVSTSCRPALALMRLLYEDCTVALPRKLGRAHEYLAKFDPAGKCQPRR